jgi:hypothetical protein
MTEVCLVVDAKTLRPGGTGPTTGNICLMLDGSAFPHRDWNDFVVVILEAWVSSILRLLRGGSESELVHFMAGPYAVEIGSLASGAVRLRAIKRDRNEVTQVDAKVTSLVETLLVASESVVNACRARDCWSRDADKLCADLAALRRQAIRLKN